MKKSLITAAVASCIVMGGFSTVAFADTTPAGSTTPPTNTATNTSATTSFDSKYQSNVATENQLLQQAQAANSTDATVVALLSSDQNINQQIGVLYGVEQSLYAAKSGIPAMNSEEEHRKDELAKLTKERQDLLVQSNKEWQIVNLSMKNHGKVLLKAAEKAHDDTQRKLNIVNQQIKSIEQRIDKGDWQAHPYHGGLTTLQDSILQLQSSAIHYAREAIALEGASTSSGSGTSSNSASTDSSNAVSSSTAPVQPNTSASPATAASN